MYTEEELVVTANVDWLTCTTSSEARGALWLSTLHQMVKMGEKTKGMFHVKHWQALGYKGYSIDGMRYGFSPSLGYIVVLSGQASTLLWGAIIGDPVKTTRIDLACTIRIACEHKRLAKNYFDVVVEKQTAGDSMGGRKYSLIQTSSQGETLYIGSRKSQQFGRIYDKGVQDGSAPPGFKWRYEVEYKKPTSGIVAKAVDSSRRCEAQTIQDTVYDWFHERVATPVFQRGGDGVRVSTETVVTTMDKKLVWLRNQVRPSIQELIACGRTKDCMDALGLTGYKWLGEDGQYGF